MSAFETAPVPAQQEMMTWPRPTRARPFAVTLELSQPGDVDPRGAGCLSGGSATWPSSTRTRRL